MGHVYCAQAGKSYENYGKVETTKSNCANAATYQCICQLKQACTALHAYLLHPLSHTQLTRPAYNTLIRRRIAQKDHRAALKTIAQAAARSTNAHAQYRSHLRVHYNNTAAPSPPAPAKNSSHHSKPRLEYAHT